MPAWLVTLGDSVHWGQGLRRADKLHGIVASELRNTRPDLENHLLAHSGAIIGVGAIVARQRADGPSGTWRVMRSGLSCRVN